MASTLTVDKIKGGSSGVALTLPTNDGSAGQLLKTNGSAVLSWATDVDTGITSVAADTTPQLGGSLDVNGSSIVSASNGDIAITPNGTGDVVLDGLKYPQADGTAGYVLKTDGSAQLSWVAQTTDTDTTYTSSDFTHDSLSGVTANEHIDWTTDQGTTNVHSGNYTDTDTVYAHPTGDGNIHVPAYGSSTSGQLLTSTGTSSTPTWQAAPQGVSNSKLFYFGSFN